MLVKYHSQTVGLYEGEGSLLLPASLVLSHVKELQVYLHIFQQWLDHIHLILKPLCKWSRRDFISYFLIEEGLASTKRHDLSKDWITAKMALRQALFYIYVYMCVCIHTHTQGLPRWHSVYTHTPKNTHIHTHTIYMHLFIYWPYMVCGILVPEPGIQPAPPALEGQGLSHWTTKEVPSRHCFRMWGSHRKSLYLCGTYLLMSGRQRKNNNKKKFDSNLENGWKWLALEERKSSELS